MRTYDPADYILYVHLAQDPTPTGPSYHRDECHRLSAGYANVSFRARLTAGRAAGARPTLVLLPGRPAAADGPAASALPALRLVT
jgi:hypothetical protein